MFLFSFALPKNCLCLEDLECNLLLDLPTPVSVVMLHTARQKIKLIYQSSTHINKIRKDLYEKSPTKT